MRCWRFGSESQCIHKMILSPKLVALDTATWGLLASENSEDVHRIFRTFESGVIIPFFTSIHLSELTQHGGDEVLKKRIQMLRRLLFVSYIKATDPGDIVGFLLDLHEREIQALLHEPTLSVDEVANRVRPKVADGFCSGSDLCNQLEDQWLSWRALFAKDVLRKNAETASITHFPLPGVNLDEKIPNLSEGIEIRSKEEAVRFFQDRIPWPVEKLKVDGDKYFRETPDEEEAYRVAASFLQECYEDIVPLMDDPANFLEKLLEQAGVERGRLSENPTIGEVGEEATFMEYLKTHERRLNLPAGTIKNFVRREFLPSWIVRILVDQKIKKMQRAEGSSLNDKFMIPFAMYLDAFEADKRICDCVRRASKEHPFMATVNQRIFRRGSMTELAGRLEALEKADYNHGETPAIDEI